MDGTGRSPSAERRRHPRVPSRDRCWCEGDDITVYAQIGDLSEGGLFLRTAAPLAPGSRVKLSLGALQGALDASVAWRREPPWPPGEAGVGLRFHPRDGRTMEALRRLLRSLRGAGA